ncbi:MAG: hypothetical protein AAF677_14630 [Pseudomonadota bacterium]
MVGDDYVIGSLLLPYLAGLFCVDGLLQRRRHAAWVAAAVLGGLMVAAMTSAGGPALWVVAPLGGFIGFLNAEARRLGEARRAV